MNRLETTATRNRKKPQSAEGVYDDGYLRVEHQNHYAAIGGTRLKLARAEFRLLSILTQSGERYVPAEAVWRQLWDEPKPLNAKSLRVFICGIRRRLAPFGIRIESAINIGYRLFLPKSSS